MRRSVCLCLMTLILTGCASSDGDINQDRYTLLDGVSAKAYSVPYTIDMSLHDILTRGGIVIRTSDVTSRIARHHRWGEDLKTQLTVMVADAFLKAQVEPPTTLCVDVSRFETDTAGNVRLEAAAHLKDQATNTKHYVHIGRIDTVGYDAVVREMRNGWSKVSSEIARDFGRH